MEEDKRILDGEILGEVAGGAERSNLPVIRYTVVKGDNLSTLAKRYGTTVDAIVRMNPIIKKKNLIVIGWTLMIPDHWS